MKVSIRKAAVVAAAMTGLILATANGASAREIHLGPPDCDPWWAPGNCNPDEFDIPDRYYTVVGRDPDITAAYDEAVAEADHICGRNGWVPEQTRLDHGTEWEWEIYISCPA